MFGGVLDMFVGILLVSLDCLMVVGIVIGIWLVGGA